jgi:hypothetical protein
MFNLTKNKFFSDFTDDEIIIGYNSMLKELSILPINHPIRVLFDFVWDCFENEKFSYDGATFVKERYKNTIFEVAAFIHDFRNYLGYVGKEIDRELLCIMIILNYKPELIIQRKILMLLTPINILRHIKNKNYKKELPKNLIQL